MLPLHSEHMTAVLNLVHIHALYHLCTADECYAQTGDSQLELHFYFFFSILLVQCYYNKIYLKKTECFGHFTLGRTLLFIRQTVNLRKRKGVQRANIESISQQ